MVLKMMLLVLEKEFFNFMYWTVSVVEGEVYICALMWNMNVQSV